MFDKYESRCCSLLVLFCNCNDPLGFLTELIVCYRYGSTNLGIKNELFSLLLVCVKGNCSFRTCHSESVINNVVTYTSAQEQVGLVKSSDTMVNTSSHVKTKTTIYYSIMLKLI